MVFVLAVLALLLSYWLTGRLCSPCSRLYLLDHPNARSLHSTPTPRTGGLAIMAGLTVCLTVAWLSDKCGDFPLVGFSIFRATAEKYEALWIIGVALALGGFSFLDDRAGLSPAMRLTVHAIAAVGVLFGAGLMVSLIPLPYLGAVVLGWLSAPFSLLFLIWMTNLYNFMDGIDGFAGGMTVVGFSFLGYMAWRGGHLSIALVSVLIVAAVGGFLLYNMPPAKIFMGDVGSVTLGFLAGSISLWGVRGGLFDVWVPVLIFSPFIADATLTLLRRILRGEKVWQAHREHYYQRLVRAGWGHRKTVLAEYVLMLACGVSALSYVRLNEPWRLMLLMAWMAIYLFLARSVTAIEKRYSVESRRTA